MPAPGMLITFEGGEGCGKSTQARLLHRRLLQHRVPALLTQEPGGTSLGNRIRDVLKRQVGTSVSPEAELLLFAASRAQLVTEIIRPGLREGAIVVCDRFDDSTVAYQGYGRGIDIATIKAINELATGDVRPGLSILLDIAPEQGLARKSKVADRFEQEGLEFHRRVRAGYLQLAAGDPGRWLVVDATLSRVTISRLIWKRVSGLPAVASLLKTADAS